jgi:CRP-like cAMP-binding protein
VLATIVTSRGGQERYDRHIARKDAKLGLVQSVPLFSQCAKRELEAIASTADLIEVPAGMELVRQGGHSNELVIIAEGAVDVTQDGTSIRSLGSGDFFGEVALVTGGTRTASVTTTTPSTLLVLTDRAFWPLAEQMPSIQTSVLKTLAERLGPETV